MKHYLYLPFSKCKNCRHLDASASRVYNRCHTSKEKCPAFEVEIVIRDSVVSMAQDFKKAVAEHNFEAQSDILVKLKKLGPAFTYKFKQELEK